MMVQQKKSDLLPEMVYGPNEWSVAVKEYYNDYGMTIK